MPFSDRWKLKSISFEYRVNKTGQNFLPRFFCDDPDSSVPVAQRSYLLKSPAAHFDVQPRVEFLGNSVDWTIANSNSATSTIATFDIFWNGPGPVDIVAGDWAVDPKSGSVTYTAVGEYIPQGTVTDVLNVTSQVGSATVRIIDEVQAAFVGTNGSGVYSLPPGGTPVQINNGLSGDFLNVRHLIMPPQYKTLPPSQQHVWIATLGGVALTVDGGENWTTIDPTGLGSPENGWGDDPAPITTDLDTTNISFSAANPQQVFVMRTTISPELRTWVYKSEDYGATWSNKAVTIGLI